VFGRLIPRPGRFGHVACQIVDRVDPVGPGGGCDFSDLVGFIVRALIVERGRAAGLFHQERPVAQFIQRPVLLPAGRSNGAAGERPLVKRLQPVQPVVESHFTRPAFRRGIQSRALVDQWACQSRCLQQCRFYKV